MNAQQIFLLSPASTSGKRASMVLSEKAGFDLARKLREEGATLGEVFSFLSGLYFRGKLSYGKYFSRPIEGTGPLVITSNRGLLPYSTVITLDDLRNFASTDISFLDDTYTIPLRRDCLSLRERLTPECKVVLLGSIASDKYVQILRDVFAEQLVFPFDFIGRGDMSRGGLLLRASASGEELAYVRLSEIESRRGRRPPKLAPRVAG